MGIDYNKEIEILTSQLNRDEAFVHQQGAIFFKDIFKRLTILYLFYRYLAERGIANQAPRGVRILYAKMADSLIGILRLLQDGHPGPAAIVLRSLFETSINLEVILRGDVQERSKLFEDYLHIERIRNMDKFSITEEQKNEFKRRFEEVKNNYHPKRPISWCWKIFSSQKGSKHNNPTVKELCAYIGHPERYEDIYGSLSAAIHPVPSYEGWIRRADGHMELGSQFGHQIEMVAKLSMAYAAESLIHVIQFLKPEDESDLINVIVFLLPPKNSELRG